MIKDHSVLFVNFFVLFVYSVGGKGGDDFEHD
jgi:hypothetical protein